LQRYVENGSFFSMPIPMEAQFFKHANQAYQDFAVRLGFFDTPQPVTFQLYQETLQKFRLSAAGFREPVAPEPYRQRILDCFDPLPVWYRPFEEAMVDRAAFPYHAITQRPMAMYHSWGSMNAWLRQIHTRNPLYVPGPICDELDLRDGDWCGSFRIPAASRWRFRAWKRSTPRPAGPGTPLANAPAHGRWTTIPRKQGRAS